MKYIYFVSFSHTNGFGNNEIKTSEKIDDFETLKEIQKLIAEDLKQKRSTRSSNN
jgi:hypothetical protein